MSGLMMEHGRLYLQVLETSSRVCSECYVRHINMARLLNKTTLSLLVTPRHADSQWPNITVPSQTPPVRLPRSPALGLAATRRRMADTKCTPAAKKIVIKQAPTMAPLLQQNGDFVSIVDEGSEDAI